MNWNVVLCFIFRISDGISSGIWASSVLSNFISTAQGNDDAANEKVGIAQAIQGTFLVAAALPAAWLASRYRRDSILRTLGCIAFAAAATTAYALLLDSSTDQYRQYVLLCGGLALWGVAQANAPVLDALFADSVPTGSRSRLYTRLHMAYISSQGAGPAVAAGVFYLHGDTWDIETMRHVMLVGMALSLLPCTLLMFFNDDKTLGAESEGLLKVLRRPSGGRGRGGTRSHGGGPDHNPLAEPLLADESGWRWEDEHDLAGFEDALASEPPSRTASPPPHPAHRISGGGGSGGGAAAGGGRSAASGGAAAAPGADAAGAEGAEGHVKLSVAEGEGEEEGPVESHAIDNWDTLTVYSHSSASSVFSGRSHDVAGSWGPTLPSPSLPPVLESVAAEARAAGGSAQVSPAKEPMPLPALPAAAAAAGGAGVGGGGMGRRYHAALEAIEGAKGSGSGLSESGAAPAAHMTRPRSFGSAPTRPSSVSVSDDSSAYHTEVSIKSRVSAASDATSAVAAAAAAAAAAGAAAAAPITLKPASSSQQQLRSGRPPSPPQGRAAAAYREAGASATAAAGAATRPAPAVFVPPLNRAQIAAAAAAAAAGGGQQHGSAPPSGRSAASSVLASPAAAPAPHLTPARADGSSRGAKGAWQPAQLLQPAHAAATAAAASPRTHAAAGTAGAVVPHIAVHAAGAGAEGAAASAAAAARQRLLQRRSCGCLGIYHIPFILAMTDCVLGLASGMTIKFFPIFFKQQVQLSPVWVNLMYCAVPLTLSLASWLSQRQSRAIGRVPTMVVNRAIGIALLFWIAAHVECWGNGRLMAPIYILRTSIMNANYPIQKSILMDFVPKESRAKWNSVESVTSFGWSGSAALGGYLIHQYGFQLTFFITAVMQAVAWMVSMLLLPIVPSRELALAELQGYVLPVTAAAPAAAQQHQAAASGGGAPDGAAGRMPALSPRQHLFLQQQQQRRSAAAAAAAAAAASPAPPPSGAPSCTASPRGQ